jgi:hypothetical protein
MPDHGAVLHTALSRMRRVTGLPATFGGAVSRGFPPLSRGRVMDTGHTWSDSLT